MAATESLTEGGQRAAGAGAESRCVKPRSGDWIARPRLDASPSSGIDIALSHPRQEPLAPGGAEPDAEGGTQAHRVVSPQIVQEDGSPHHNRPTIFSHL
jgi:hypothetical protein